MCMLIVDGDLQYPGSLWYDQSRRRLYIGEWSGGRLMLIDSIEDSHTTVASAGVSKSGHDVRGGQVIVADQLKHFTTAQVYD